MVVFCFLSLHLCLDFDTYTIRFMTIERPKVPLRKLLQSHGYIYLFDLGDFGETVWMHQSLEFLGIERLKDVARTSLGRRIRNFKVLGK